MADPIIIIGTGLSGYGLAKEIRRHDGNIPLQLFTADDGHFYSKPQLSTALAKNKLPHELVMVNARKIAEQLKAEILTQCEVSSIDNQAHCLHANDKKYPYHKLVLACGANPIHFDFPGGANDKLIRINNLMQYSEFRKKLILSQHVAIIGSGLIGCEFANDLIANGYKVSIISLDNYPLKTLLPSAAGEALQSALAQASVTWYCQRSVTEIANHGQGVEISLDDNTHFYADHVISAIGLRANTALAKEADLAVRHGILANQYLQTSDQHIYAIGDCAEINGRLQQFILPINHSIKALAQTLLGNPAAVNFPIMPITIKTPCCPIVTCPPIEPTGKWNIVQDAYHVKGLAYDNHDQLSGFALTGNQVSHKNTLIKALNATHI